MGIVRARSSITGRPGKCRLAAILAAGVTLCSAGAAPVPAAHGAGIVDRLMARMTLSQKIGQLFMMPVNGAALYREVHEWHAGGLIVYGSDISSARQGRALLAAAQHDADIPLLVSVDEEGGSVNQIPPSDGVPAMRAPRDYGALAAPDRVYRDARAAGQALRALGINMDLAPVLDVLLDRQSAIGDRAYGADPLLVARLGMAAMRGLQQGGVAATAKHFLGLGSVTVDEHVGLPVVRRSVRQFEQDELIPMRAAIRSGVDALMVTHTIIPALDPSGRPASLSRPVITFIRTQLGYQGLIITDSLAMGGLSRWGVSNEEASVRAVAAGDDMILLATDSTVVRRAMDDVQRAVQMHRIGMGTIDTAVRHILMLKLRLGLLHGNPWPGRVH